LTTRLIRETDHIYQEDIEALRLALLLYQLLQPLLPDLLRILHPEQHRNRPFEVLQELLQKVPVRVLLKVLQRQLLNLRAILQVKAHRRVLLLVLQKVHREVPAILGQVPQPANQQVDQHLVRGHRHPLAEHHRIVLPNQHLNQLANLLQEVHHILQVIQHQKVLLKHQVNLQVDLLVILGQRPQRVDLHLVVPQEPGQVHRPVGRLLVLRPNLQVGQRANQHLEPRAKVHPKPRQDLLVEPPAEVHRNPRLVLGLLLRPAGLHHVVPLVRCRVHPRVELRRIVPRNRHPELPVNPLVKHLVIVHQEHHPRVPVGLLHDLQADLHRVRGRALRPVDRHRLHLFTGRLPAHRNHLHGLLADHRQHLGPVLLPVAQLQRVQAVVLLRRPVEAHRELVVNRLVEQPVDLHPEAPHKQRLDRRVVLGLLRQRVIPLVDRHLERGLLLLQARALLVQAAKVRQGRPAEALLDLQAGPPVVLPVNRHLGHLHGALLGVRVDHPVNQVHVPGPVHQQVGLVAKHPVVVRPERHLGVHRNRLLAALRIHLRNRLQNPGQALPRAILPHIVLPEAHPKQVHVRRLVVQANRLVGPRRPRPLRGPRRLHPNPVLDLPVVHHRNPHHGQVVIQPAKLQVNQVVNPLQPRPRLLDPQANRRHERLPNQVRNLLVEVVVNHPVDQQVAPLHAVPVEVLCVRHLEVLLVQQVVRLAVALRDPRQEVHHELLANLPVEALLVRGQLHLRVNQLLAVRLVLLRAVQAIPHRNRQVEVLRVRPADPLVVLQVGHLQEVHPEPLLVVVVIRQATPRVDRHQRALQGPRANLQPVLGRVLRRVDLLHSVGLLHQRQEAQA
jgi:hypothetical protein